ncbi:FAD-binding oxidoreductase [Humibacter ginsenosidimutans]|uniref:FAD-binding protein n=1 Tax=Humibacter ginsenosidimutans TaxID=2599293 RepID=A0A5B8LZI3_9MICO|nr:FAD-linked oxidase C-terminal domain-containing protein [Humibacter ginsenosidimutans]QDZ13476.1 FAD-binding protein [Humibacter ginsenosidimutans]
MPDPIARLAAELGDAFTTQQELLEDARADRSGWVSASAPLGVVRAHTVEQVQAALRIATELRLPVVPRGTGTGLAGGATGSSGELVIDVSAMNRILEIRPDDELAVVQPGVINADLDAALEPHGLWFAPDPASKNIASIGGNIATNAGGLLCAKYGVTRESVLGLQVVLADGRLLRIGHRTVKGVTGYDLTSLFIGSEGTLGIIVEATVRTLPRPSHEPTTLVGVFPGVREAASASAAITAARLRPAMCELVDAAALAAVRDHLGEAAVDANPLLGDRTAGASLIVQFDDADAADRADAAAELMRAFSGIAQVSSDREESERLLELRRAFHPSLEALGEVLIEDVAVPRSRLADMFDEIVRIQNEYGVSIPTVAHAADGNLHPNFVYEGGEVPEHVWAAANELFTTALRLGGTLTGEHGVGLLKRRWLRDELGDDSFELQRGVKAVFDPLGILNPGKVFA